MTIQSNTVLITGASRGLGANFSKVLAHDGFKIIGVGRNIQNLKSVISSLPNQDLNHSYLELDITDESQVQKMLKDLNIYALINNAGIAGPSYKTWDYPNEDWKKVIDIDLSGIFYTSKVIVPHMIENNYGRIVNISSIAGKEGNPNAMPYSAAKAGVIALTKSLGKELADKNIAVNCITPAAAKTKIFDQISQEHIDYMLSKIPRNRFVLVEELASLAAWMSSEENSFTTGAVFDLSGGRATY